MGIDKDRGMALCSGICALTDELRDLWLQKLSKGKAREIMDLTVSQQRMLRAIWRMTRLSSPEGVSLRELAEKLGLSSSAVSVMVECMVKRKYIERVTSPEDRRKVLIRISAEGNRHRVITEGFFGDLANEFIAQCIPGHLEIFEKVLDDFTHFLINKKEIDK